MLETKLRDGTVVRTSIGNDLPTVEVGVLPPHAALGVNTGVTINYDQFDYELLADAGLTGLVTLDEIEAFYHRATVRLVNAVGPGDPGPLRVCRDTEDYWYRGMCVPRRGGVPIRLGTQPRQLGT